jgi:spore coat-associated protein N
VSASRRALWVRSGLLGLVVFALLAFTLHSLRLSDASFTTATSNTSNVFIAGTLGHINNQNGRVLITASGLMPGDSRTGTMTLTGTGTIAGEYSLAPSSIVDVPASPASPALSGQLDLVVEEVVGPTYETIWEGDLTDLEADPAELGTIAPAAARTYRITLDYPSGTNEAALQGASMTLVLQVSGVSP